MMSIASAAKQRRWIDNDIAFNRAAGDFSGMRIFKQN